MKYFVCPCIFEVKLGCGIVKIDRLIEEGFIDSNYLAVLNNECCYICCKETINCLHEVISNIPMRIFEFELMMKNRGGCIYMYKNNQISLGECCSICINFVILRFTSCFFIDV